MRQVSIFCPSCDNKAVTQQPSECAWCSIASNHLPTFEDLPSWLPLAVEGELCHRCGLLRVVRMPQSTPPQAASNGHAPGLLATLLGLCEFGRAIQSYLDVHSAWRLPVTSGWFLLGLATTFAGYRTFRGSVDAAVGATLLSGLNVLLMAFGFVSELSKGKLSSLTLVALLLSLATVIFAGLAVTAERRRQLAAKGPSPRR